MGEKLEKVTVAYKEIKIDSPKYKSRLVIFPSGVDKWVARSISEINTTRKTLTIPKWLYDKWLEEAEESNSAPTPQPPPSSNKPPQDLPF